jgi:2-polyprenyl-6-methoxyphenol hydroxylase-like FAD-dependent oxidoreductase
MSGARRIVGFVALDVVGEFAHEPYQFLDIPFVPGRENRPADPLARRVHRIGHGFALRRHDRFAHATVGAACLSLDKTEALQFGDLPTDGRVVAPDAVGEIDHPDRAPPLDADQQWKQRTIERDAGLPDHGLVALGAVHDADDVDQRAVQIPDLFRFMCILHIISPCSPPYYVHPTHMEMAMTEHFACDVLICGAGAAGLTLAIELARRGISFRLIEKMDGPFRGSRGKGIQPRTQEIFEDLGILDRVVAAGGLYPPQREYRDDGSHAETLVMEQQDPTSAEPYHLALLVPQFLTEAVMRERLLELGHRPEFGCELVGFEQDEVGVTVRIAGKAGEQVTRVRCLVGADGGRSFVRNALDIGFPGKTLGVRAVVADVVLTGLGRDAWHRFSEGSMARQMSLCPLAGTAMFQLQAPIPLEGDIDLSAEGLAAMVAERVGRDDIRIQSVSWASAFTMNARLADRYRVGRALLVGDAAHIHPPTGGQGLNTSVQDAYNLGWKLAAVLRGAPDTLLDSYEEERRPIAASMLGLATRLLDAAKRGEMRRGREVHQLDIGYPESSLALEKPERLHGLLAGDRAPDAPIRGVAGQQTRLFELFQGAHWTLLGSEVARDAVRPRPGLHIHTFGSRGDVVDAHGHFRDAYALACGDWALVRPDGYVGAIVTSNEVEALERYFENVGLGLKDGAHA